MSKKDFLTILLFSLFFIILVYIAIIFSNSIIENKINTDSWWYYISHDLPYKYIYKFMEEPHAYSFFIIIIMPMILISILLSSISLISLIIFIFIHRLRLHSNIRSTYRAEIKIENLLIDYIISGSKLSLLELKKFNSNYQKMLIANKISVLMSSIIGDSANKLRNLFIVLGLDELILKRIKKPLLYNNFHNIKIISRMNITKAYQELKKQEKRYNSSDVNIEIAIALIHLNTKNPLSFLKKINYPLTQYHQLYIYDTLIRHSIQPPNLAIYLQSKNISVVIFCLKMIGLFKQDVVYDKIINLLYSENYDIRKQVIKALGDLKNKNAIPLLIEIYPKEDTQNKIEILKSIAKIGVYDYKTFILDAMSNPDIGIRIEAAKILLGDSIDTEDILTLIQDKYQDKEMHDILQHVMDNRNTI
jgi:hypothetical protein